MGFFSWKTCDTQESIANDYSNGDVQTVFLLKPDGQSPVKEAAYDGYGVFGGVDAYAWLAQANLGRSDVELGISLNHGHYLESDEYILVCSQHATQRLYEFLIEQDTIKGGTKKIVSFGRYDQPIAEMGGLSANQCRANGKVEEKDFAGHIKYPLKFSFNSNARYEDHPASDDCEFQGFFYDRED